MCLVQADHRTDPGQPAPQLGSAVLLRLDVPTDYKFLLGAGSGDVDEPPGFGLFPVGFLQRGQPVGDRLGLFLP